MLKLHRLVSYICSRYTDMTYPLEDRLYFLFGTAGTFSAFAAFAAALGSGLPAVAAVASFISFLVMLVIMVLSFFTKDISAGRIFCSIFLNFFMFPTLFWVTGGVDCGMVFYFILGLCVTTLIVKGRLRTVLLVLSLLWYSVCLWIGFQFPELAYPLSFEERCMDTISSFAIVAVFIVAVIIIMMREYDGQHRKAAASAEALKQQALTDSLTTLYNYRYLHEALEDAVTVCRTEGTRASILLIDIDDFKRINDVHGHLQGNQVLCQLAALLKAWERDMVVARYGGEEFMVLMPGYDRERAMEAAEEIRQIVCRDRLLQDMTGDTFSISGGVAEYTDKDDLDSWIRRADVNMYAAKRSGKNRIVG